MEWMILPFRRYAECTGRSRRMEYWMFALLNAIVVTVLMLVIFGAGGAAGGQGREVARGGPREVGSGGQQRGQLLVRPAPDVVGEGAGGGGRRGRHLTTVVPCSPA